MRVAWMAPPQPCLCSCQIMDLKVTEVQYQLPHQWHQYLRDQEVLGICAVVDSPMQGTWRPYEG